MKKHTKSVSWIFFDQFFQIGSQIINIIFITRLFTPDDFGIFAIGLIIIGIAKQVFAMGLSTALIQFKNHDKYYGSAWTANIFISLFVTITLIITIPSVINQFFNDYSNYIFYFQLLSISIILSAANNIGVIELFRLRITNKLFFIRGFLEIVKIILIFLLYTYFGDFRALIYAFLSIEIIRLIVSYFIAPIKTKLKFNLNQFKIIYSFSGWLQLKNIGKVIVNQLDSILIASLLSSQDLGLYNRANTISKVPQRLVLSFNELFTFPYISEVRDNKDTVKKYFEFYMFLLIMLVSSVALIVNIFSADLIELVLGVKWKSISTPLGILIISMGFNVIIYSFFPFLRAYGKTKKEFKLFSYQIIILLIISYPLVFNYGIIGASIANLITAIIILPIFVEKTKEILFGSDLRRIYYLILTWSIVGILFFYFYSFEYSNIWNLSVNVFGVILSYCFFSIIILFVLFPYQKLVLKDLLLCFKNRNIN